MIYLKNVQIFMISILKLKDEIKLNKLLICNFKITVHAPLKRMMHSLKMMLSGNRFECV